MPLTFKRKHMIQDIEAELIELSEIFSKNENMEVSEETDIDKAILIHLEEKRKTQAYQKRMNTDIENINTFGKEKK